MATDVDLELERPDYEQGRQQVLQIDDQME